MPRPLIALLVLVIAGFVRIPVEERITQAQVDAGFDRVNLSLDLRSQIGQASFIAVLGGYRSLAASMLWLQAHTAWEKTQWDKMYLYFDTVTTLQPRATVFWDMAAWHMAWNASVAARRDQSIPLEALRISAQKRYFDIGRDFLERGIQNNPDNAGLYDRLGLLLKDKLGDHCAAAEVYRTGATKPGALSYMKRFAAYELSQCPGKERQAYLELKRLYDLGEDERLPTLIVRLKAMEELLNIPQSQRIPDPLPNPGIPRSAPTTPPAQTIPGTSQPLPGQGAPPSGSSPSP